MISLQLFGGAALLGDAGPITGPPSQRRRLALLAVLAAAPGRSVSRDKLIAHFWPDDDRERARHFLADSVFMLRKHLGKDSILTVGDDLLLNAEVVECDVCAFREALAAGELERAVGLYRGPFLDGFFVGDAPEFERWVEKERDRLAQLRGDALDKLAREAESAGSPERAVEWWKQLAAHDPLSSRVAMRLMQSLVTGGDRAAALQHARVHSALLREVLDADPDPEVEALAARISAQKDPSPIAPVTAISPDHPADSRLPLQPAVVADQAVVGNDAVEPSVARARDDESGRRAFAPPAEGAVPTPSHRSARRRILAPLVLVLVAFVLIVTWRWGPDAVDLADPSPTSSTSIAILPFHVHGNPEYAYLDKGMVTLLSTELDVAGVLQPIDPLVLLSRWEELAGDEPLTPEQEGELARALGAELFVTGNVVESNGRLQIAARLYRPGDAPVYLSEASAKGMDEDLFALADTLSRQILEDRLEGPADRLSRIAVSTTRSTGAFKAYQEGEQAFRAADYGRAAESFRKAVQADPSYALAYYRLSMAEEWSFRFPQAQVAARNAWESAANLNPRYQQLVSAWYNFITGNADEAERLYNELLLDDPDDVEAQSGMGEVLAHYNPIRGRSIAQAIRYFDKVLLLAPSYGEARFHMMEFAARDSNTTTFDSLLAGVDPGSPQRLSWEAARAAAWGAPSGRAAATLRLDSAQEIQVGIAAARTAVHFRDLPAAKTLAGMLMESDRPAWRAAGQIMAAQIHLMQGERELATDMLEAAGTIEPAWALEISTLAELLPDAPVNADRLRQLRQELENWDPTRRNPELAFFFATHADVHDLLRLYLLALLSVKLREDETATNYAKQLADVGRTTERRELATNLARSVDAHLAAARGEPDRALSLLELAQPPAPLERIAVSPFFARALDRYLRGNLLRDLKPDEARAWYRSLMEGPDILFWTAAAQREQELVAARR